MENRGVIVTTSHSKQWPAKIRGCPVSTAIKLLDWMPLHHLKHCYPLIHIFPLDAHLSIEIQWVLQATVHPPFFSLLPASDHWSKKNIELAPYRVCILGLGSLIFYCGEKAGEARGGDEGNCTH